MAILRYTLAPFNYRSLPLCRWEAFVNKKSARGHCASVWNRESRNIANVRKQSRSLADRVAVTTDLAKLANFYRIQLDSIR